MRSSRRQRKKACYEILFMPLLGLHVTCAQRTIVVCGPHKNPSMHISRSNIYDYAMRSFLLALLNFPAISLLKLHSFMFDKLPDDWFNSRLSRRQGRQRTRPPALGLPLHLALGRVCNWGHGVHINRGHCRDVAILSAATWRA